MQMFGTFFAPPSIINKWCFKFCWKTRSTRARDTELGSWNSWAQCC